MCDNYGALKVLKELDKADPQGNGPIWKKYSKNCVPDRVGLVQLNVMYAEGDYAFTCSRFKSSPREMPIFVCGYVLISDIIDDTGKPVALNTLQRDAVNKTIAGLKPDMN